MYKILLIIFLTLIDILVKQIVFHSIDLNNFIYITSFFDLTHIHNFGISFGLFSNVIPAGFFILVGCIISIILIVFIINTNNLWEKWGYIYILAGAFGNIIDRLINGFVIDFIYLHYKEFYWPAFNFADIYISIGVLIIVLNILGILNKKIIN